MIDRLNTMGFSPNIVMDDVEKEHGVGSIILALRTMVAAYHPLKKFVDGVS